MLRTFRQHHTRTIESLDVRWDFVTSDAKRPPRKFDRTMQVPACWEMTPGLEAYRGTAWYRCEIAYPRDRWARLVFGGVSHTADVYIDGKHLAHHEDAFTPFELLIPPGKSDTRVVCVRVDNSFGEHAALHIPNDYYSYGGITRPVELQVLPDTVMIERAAFTPVRKPRGRWALDVAVTIRNVGSETDRLTIAVDLPDLGKGIEHVEAGVRIGAGKATTRTFRVECPEDVQPWSPDQPALYEASIFLTDSAAEAVRDDLVTRVGFREVKTRGTKIMLNGEPIRLRGVNRHEDHGSFGCAIPVQQMANDLEIIRDLGGNFVRTSHYPNDMRFLDLCDEMGILVWEESHTRSTDMDHPRFKDQIDTSTREMLHWHHNHPSIIMWGLLNEHPSDQAKRRTDYARLIKIIRDADLSRPVTYASNRCQNDRFLDMVDIVSFNMYTGWYRGSIEDVEPRLKEVVKWLDSKDSRGGKGKPLIISEFGAGAIPGYHNPARPHWSEEYQADVLDEELRVYAGSPRVAGVAIWQFCDVRVTPEKWWRTRPRSMNNKGIVNQHRQPKLAYETVKQRFDEVTTKD